MTVNEIMTALLVVVTAVYVVLTHRIARANNQMVTAVQEQIIALDRPYIEVSTFLVPRSIIVYLRIKNTGRTSAGNLRLKIDKDFYKFGRREENNNLARFNAFNQLIQTFPPGNELIFPLAQSFVIFGENASDKITPRTFKVTATYNYRDKITDETTVIDLSPYYQTNPEPDPIIDRLAGITTSLDQLVTAVRGISLLLRPSASSDELETDIDNQ